MKSTIIVVVRERFSPFIDSLRSLFTTVTRDVPVIVVDCGCPEDICSQLAELQRQRYFDWIHTSYFLLPHEARNRALCQVKTEYVVFADNDLHYEPGWLQALEANAETQSADVVAPLICIGPPAATIIHHAGGELCWKKYSDATYLNEIHRLANVPLRRDIEFDKVAPLQNYGVEFHCFLVRRRALELAGGLDERLIYSEHIDFALRCLLNNLKITFEKDAIVTYMAKQAFTLKDFQYFFFRWSLHRVRQSADILADRWTVPVKSIHQQIKWTKRHHRRAVITFFPRWLTKVTSDQVLMGLMKPVRLVSVSRAERKRRRFVQSPFTAPLANDSGINAMLQRIT